MAARELSPAAVAYLIERGVINAQLIIDAGLYSEPDSRGVQRVWFPWTDPTGGEIYTTGRSIEDADPKYRHAAGEKPPLYATPDAWDAPEVVLVEGQIDALLAAQAGIPAFATSGTAIAAEASDILDRRKRIILIPDQDAKAGPKWRADAIKQFGGACRLAEVLLPEDCKDLGDVAVKHGVEAVATLIDQANDIPGTGLERSRLVDGGTFVFDQPLEVESVWGKGQEVAWAVGEPTMIVSPTGLGKTTLAQRIVLAMAGVGAREVLGLPVRRATMPILYIAADRPRQARRSLRRMVSEQDRERLEKMLIVWSGPLPFDASTDPERFADWVRNIGAGSVIIDSLKDVSPGFTKDEEGMRIARSWQLLVAREIDLLLLHHQRKGQADNRKPKAIDDVYGSVWLPATCGSVLLLWGKPGDAYLELSQLKMPADDIGPIRVFIDHDAGHVSVEEGTDLLAVLRHAPKGLTPDEAACAVYGSEEPTKNQRHNVQRRFKRLEQQGLAYKINNISRQNGAIKLPDRYYATEQHGLSSP